MSMRDDPDFKEMLDNRKRALSGSIKASMWLIVVVAVILLWMFLYLA